MQRTPTICATFLLAGIICAAAAPPVPPDALNKASLSELESRLKDIDTELSQLARPSLRSGLGSLGYRSKQNPGNKPQWIEIEFGKEEPIDQIVLAPILWRDPEKGFTAEGFPAEFRITLGTADDRKGTVLGEFRSEDFSLPRIAPWIIPANGVPASWFRMDVIRFADKTLFPRSGYQLSEIMVFSGEENLALRRPVKVAAPSPQFEIDIWNEQFLTDGLMPYQMDSGRGARSIAYLGDSFRSPHLDIDLGEELALSRLHLHAMDQGDTAPLAIAGNLGFPKHLELKGSSTPDFSESIPLLDIRYSHPNEIGPVMMWNFPETTCRYLRLIAPSGNKRIQIGFTEIEVFSEGRNVAKGKEIATNLPNPNPNIRSLDTLTDGSNFYGEILTVRAWMNQLARRHDQENERPLVTAELNWRYARQKTNLNRMYWLAAVLVAGIALSSLVVRNRHLHHVARIKERFAADLHDEIGANLHTIELHTELIAKKAKDLPVDLSLFLERIQSVTKRSSLAVRHMSELQSANRLFGNVAEDMRRAAERIVVDLKHELTIEGKEHLARLKPRTQTDLFLFYKECLINICRHAEASEISTQLIATPRQVHLTIADNGHGMPAASANEIPPSLKRRAKLLKAKITLQKTENGGTCIHLKLKPGRWLG